MNDERCLILIMKVRRYEGKASNINNYSYNPKTSQIAENVLMETKHRHIITFVKQS